MKKPNTRTFLFIILMAASLLSYVYLNYVSVHGITSDAVDPIEQELTTEQDQELLLPDVRLLKKAVETGKRFLPAS